MKTVGIVIGSLVLVNGVLFGLRRAASEDRAQLVARASELAHRAAGARESSERRRSIDALVDEARSKSLHDASHEVPRDIGALRDLLVGAEHGLAIDRLSLDFRPEDRLPTGLGGSQVLASLRGRFDAVYDYLRRVEVLYLPLALENLSLRGDTESVTVTVQWAARWPIESEDAEPELGPAEVARLRAWLEHAPPPRVSRNVFSFRSTPDAEAVAADVVRSPEPTDSSRVETVEPELERPVLTGFVLARPELEPDVNRRVLAALHFDGETRLVMVGDTVGGFVVDSMEARDSVTLTRAATGERIRLTLQ